MRLYEVGGAVRDALLGLPAQDRDWVAVGATPEELLALGYKPVGRDFPVFLHPLTHEEVALARTERKSAPGYHGFTFHAAPEVTLEQDLSRRDLTINAIARDQTGQLIDPFGGQRDIQARVLRHVSAAFVEDPVRVLRLARLAARFHDFTVAPETMVLMRSMVAAGEIDALVPERVWQELARGLMEIRPSRMFERLSDCGALARLLPGLHTDAPSLKVLDLCAELHANLAVRFACLTPTPALRVPSDCRELAEVVARERAAIHASAALDAEGLLAVLERCDALRRPERFDDVLLACECGAHSEARGDARGRNTLKAGPYAPRQKLQCALQAALSVDSAATAAAATSQGLLGPAIGAAVRLARLHAVEQSAP